MNSKGDSIYRSSFIFKIISLKCHIKHTLFWSKYCHHRSAVVRYLVLNLTIQSMSIITKTTSLIPVPLAGDKMYRLPVIGRVLCMDIQSTFNNITDILLKVSKTPIPIKQSINCLWSILLIIVCSIVIFLLTMMVCLSCFYLRLLITPLTSLNFS